MSLYRWLQCCELLHARVVLTAVDLRLLSNMESVPHNLICSSVAWSPRQSLIVALSGLLRITTYGAAQI